MFFSRTTGYPRSGIIENLISTKKKIKKDKKLINNYKQGYCAIYKIKIKYS